MFTKKMSFKQIFAKITFAFAVSALTLSIGCNKTTVPEPEAEQPVPEEAITFNTTDSTTQTFGIAAAAKINTVSGVKSNVYYTDYIAADTDGQDELTITGSGFGSTRGSVTLLNVTTLSIPSIISWTDIKIVVKVKSTYNTVAAPSALNNWVNPQVKVTTNTGVTAISGSIKLVPRITTKEYQQCTWWANLRCGQMKGKTQARGQAYSNYSGSVDANYVPQAGDILIWPSQPHEAFIEGVKITTEAGGITVYTLSISEYNISPRAYSTYTTVVKIKTVSGKKQVYSGIYRSGLNKSATNYFR